MDKYNEWLNNEYISNEDKEILKNMSKEEIEDAFYTDLKFGTAGIRGIMGLGTNRINEYTIGKVTVGLSNYLNKNFESPSVVIAYDTRNNSKKYALDTALILNYYGIKTYLFDEVSSTPLLAFSVKYLNCNAGIVITSSHNSKDYNGYKVYNSLGSQIVSPEDELISKEIDNITDFKLIKKAPLNNELFNYANDDVLKAFIEENKKVIKNNDLINKYADKIRITYSSVHGVGLKTTEDILNDLNFRNYNIVKEQCTYDGNFPTASEPNPEYINNYDLAKKYAYENDSDIILMTDPDADRLGVMYKNNNGEYEYINGNLLGVIFSNYVIENSDIKENSYVVRSIVTSNLIDEIAKKNNIEVYEVLTGCKNIAKVKQTENKKGNNFVFGYEESLGYMFNIDVDDKNGFSSMICMLEILCYCKDNNMSLEDYINGIYAKYGYSISLPLSFKINKPNYSEIINNFISKLRNDEIKIDALKYDYESEVGENRSNTLKYTISENNYFIVRPSGTEPKIKVYINVINKDKEVCIKNFEITKTIVNDVFSSFLDIN